MASTPQHVSVNASLADSDSVRFEGNSVCFEGKGGTESKHPPAWQSHLPCHRLVTPLGMDRSLLSMCLGGRGRESGLRFFRKALGLAAPSCPVVSQKVTWLLVGRPRGWQRGSVSPGPCPSTRQSTELAPDPPLPSHACRVITRSTSCPWKRRADPPPVTGRSPGCRDPSVRWNAHTRRSSFLRWLTS